MAKAIMFQGTASNVGKSIIAAGFCRIFLEDGYRVAPFKAQNMALNSFVTEQGLEMGRAQVTQAKACRIKPDVHMNPILLKPSAGTGSQVIVMGKPAGHMNVQTYTDFKKKLRTVVKDAYEFLNSQYDIIVIEGAGSPAEVNLKKDDITNMHVAKLTKSPVIIIGDIDKGGVYAHFAGTFDLLDQEEQNLTAGFIINKFRGDKTQLEPANDFIQHRTQRKIFGVVPWIQDLKLPDEDSVEFKKRLGKKKSFDKKSINIALVDLPHISNFTDFDPLEEDPDVNLFVTDKPGDLTGADMIIIPGSKNTTWDMRYLQEKGFPDALKQCTDKGKMIIGICGGYQVLGKKIIDPGAVESREKEVDGLGVLDLTTVMAEEKHLTQVTALCIEEDLPVKGYEIHHGQSQVNETPFLVKTGTKEILGCKNSSGNVWGTYIHGVFDSKPFRDYILNKIRLKKNLPVPQNHRDFNIDEELSRLASILRESIDIDAIYHLLSASGGQGGRFLKKLPPLDPPAKIFD
jgi:cobyric acid synthase CobQ